MRVIVIFCCLGMLACSTAQKQAETLEETEASIGKNIPDAPEKTLAETRFEQFQDSLRSVILHAKPNENLTSSLLQEFYIRGLVSQEMDKISFTLPFDLHSFDGGAPDCYTTEISFAIPATEPIEFPEKIAATLFEHGCVDREEKLESEFVLSEQSDAYVNYFSAAFNSNLILKRSGKMYYYPHVEDHSVSVETLDKMFEQNAFEDPEMTPYQSTRMTTNEYETFLEN